MLFNKKKKAQAALEFLMTYGWAILVVLVVIGALAYFGVLNPSNFLPEKCTMGPGFSCNDFRVNGTHVFLLISNSAGQSYNVVNGTVRFGTSNCFWNSTANVTSTMKTLNSTAWASGEVASTSWTCTPALSVQSQKQSGSGFFTVYEPASGVSFGHEVPVDLSVKY